MINKQLDKPYPAVETTKQKITISFIFSLSVFAFLMIFQPFGLDDVQFYKFSLIAGNFIITLFALLLRFFVIPLILPKFFDADKWTVGKNLFSILLVIILISILNWVYNFWVGEDIVEQYNLFSFLFITVSVGFFPVVLLLVFSEKYLSQKNTNFAEQTTTRILTEPKIKETKIINILSENSSEKISIELDQLICVKSEGNYITVYFMENETLKKQMLRSSLTKILGQLTIFENIKRCHRSYIVNFNTIEKVSGNARNYSLHCTNLDFSVPVSRTFPKEILEEISN